MSIRSGILLLCFALPLAAQEPERKAPSGSAPAEIPVPDAKVEKIAEHRFRIGEIEFDAKTREIRFPAAVNLREGGPMEYLLVHEQGKVHEAIFTTAVSPLHLQIAMKLLRYQAGHGDVFNPFLPAERLEKEGGKAADRGETVFLAFAAEGGKARPAHEFVLDGESAEAMTPGGWVYTGSTVEGGSFMAEAEGSIVAIYLDPLAMFNMTREGADIDERWGARHSAIPEIGTKGVFTIRAGETPPATPE